MAKYNSKYNTPPSHSRKQRYYQCRRNERSGTGTSLNGTWTPTETPRNLRNHSAGPLPGSSGSFNANTIQDAAVVSSGIQSNNHGPNSARVFSSSAGIVNKAAVQGTPGADGGGVRQSPDRTLSGSKGNSSGRSRYFYNSKFTQGSDNVQWSTASSSALTSMVYQPSKSATPPQEKPKRKRKKYTSRPCFYCNVMLYTRLDLYTHLSMHRNSSRHHSSSCRGESVHHSRPLVNVTVTKKVKNYGLTLEQLEEFLEIHSCNSTQSETPAWMDKSLIVDIIFPFFLILILMGYLGYEHFW